MYTKWEMCCPVPIATNIKLQQNGLPNLASKSFSFMLVLNCVMLLKWRTSLARHMRSYLSVKNINTRKLTILMEEKSISKENNLNSKPNLYVFNFNLFNFIYYNLNLYKLVCLFLILWQSNWVCLIVLKAK